MGGLEGAEALTIQSIFEKRATEATRAPPMCAVTVLNAKCTQSGRTSERALSGRMRSADRGACIPKYAQYVENCFRVHNHCLLTENFGYSY